jgi:hypothetical protein
MNATLSWNNVSLVTTLGLALCLNSCAVPPPGADSSQRAARGPSGGTASAPPTATPPGSVTPVYPMPILPAGTVPRPSQPSTASRLEAQTSAPPSATPPAAISSSYPATGVAAPPTATPPRIAMSASPSTAAPTPPSRLTASPAASPPMVTMTPMPKSATPLALAEPAPSVSALIARSTHRIELGAERDDVCRAECRKDTACRSWSLVSAGAAPNRRPLCLLSRDAPPARAPLGVRTGPR